MSFDHKIRLSSHAVERFVARCRPDLDLAAARQLLAESVGGAVHLRERTLRGQEQWLLGDLGAILVCRRAREDIRLRIVVTVLAEKDAQDEQAILREHLEDLRLRSEAARPDPSDSRATRAQKASERTDLAEEAKVARAELARLQVQAKLEKEREKTLRVQMLAQATVERAQQKAAAHLGRMDLTVGALKKALRVAVRGLVTGRTAEAISLLGADNETAPYLKHSFWEAEGTKSATESEGT